MYKRIKNTTISKKNIIKVSDIEINSEHDLQKACVSKLKSHNMLCFCTDVFNGMSFIRDIRSKAIYKQHMERMGAIKGQSDLIILHNGKCTFVEFKFKKGKKSIDQEAFCERVAKMGYEVLEWRTLEECEAWIVSKLNESKI